ncbi:hypothetical protein EXU57_09015 [Segetibacter sp. 3557_3]|uniref:alpha/beta hydrolase n=1 Tax=Segetibacter sp. 3557_3 TaxID=2547429 RepID=UPI001058CD7A|nr:alpha/beta hydrolase [Segetibacter sp. 3557_3]TDH26935.1 hypothetical protein EXU57_09015 [Segetibacter sp. 3557_3]
MDKPVIFIQGGGDDGYEADKALVNSLQASLGDDYRIYYPVIQSNEELSDFGWPLQINQTVLNTKGEPVIVGHSLGASMLLKYLSENALAKKIKGIFLIATPFWSGNEDWKTGLKLQENFCDKLPHDVPFFFYHCKDDEVTPLSHLEYYKQKVTQATFRELENGGHQFNNDLTLVAQDIKSLK